MGLSEIASCEKKIVKSENFVQTLILPSNRDTADLFNIIDEDDFEGDTDAREDFFELLHNDVQIKKSSFSSYELVRLVEYIGKK